VEISLNLEDDSFGVRADTGNKGLTCGIVACVLGLLENGVVVPRSIIEIAG
jgi:hypothetical protein